MNKRLFIYGLAIWIGATVALRVSGQHLLHPTGWKNTVVLLIASFVLMGLLIRRVCGQLPQEQWLSGAFSFALPTLLLDPFSSAFFPVVFPNMSPEVAGVFGGWMLCCCAGAFVGASIHSRKQS
jgi:Family of unknown function (DUF5367)